MTTEKKLRRVTATPISLRRSFRLLISLSLAVGCVTSIPVSALAQMSDTEKLSEGPASTFLLLHEGTTHHLTELVEKRRERISKWNMLRLKRGKEYWAYRTLETADTPLRLSPELHAKYATTLRLIPDNRTYPNKHPYRYRVSEHYQRWGPVYNSAIGAAIGAAK